MVIGGEHHRICFQHLPILQFNACGTISSKSQPTHARSKSNITAGNFFIQLAQRACGKPDQIPLGIGQHGILKHLNRIPRTGSPRFLVERADEDRIVKLSDQRFRLMMRIKPLAKRHIRQRITAGVSEFHHRQHGPRKQKSLAPCQRLKARQ